MRDYIIRRLLLLAPIMIGVSLLTFSLFKLIPADAVILRCGFGCTPEVVEDLREQLGLNRPAYPVTFDGSPPFVNLHGDSQYGSWLWNIVAHQDLGRSLTEGNLEVFSELKHRLPITVELMILTIIFALVLGILPGILSAIRPNTPSDWISRMLSVLWLSVPDFYLGILIITFGSIWVGWTPPQFGEGYVPIYEDPWKNLQEFIFPAFVLSVGTAAVIMRLTRSAMLEVLRNDYIRTAWSKGLRERTVVWRHSLKNALIPVVTLVGVQIGALIGGAVIIEQLFNLNGIGKYTIEAIIRRDVFVVQSLTLVFALVYVISNLFVDIAYAWLDPRIHYT
ncbi:MAG: ABC transporter permease [Gammaproteobacteria bacterium]